MECSKWNSTVTNHICTWSIVLTFAFHHFLYTGYFVISISCEGNLLRGKMASGKVAHHPAVQTYSRFACLEEDSEEEKVEKETAEKKTNAAKNAKRRARKKKEGSSRDKRGIVRFTWFGGV